MTFTYDGVGNRVNYKLGTATDSYTYPATSNRLGTIALAAGGARAFTYDAAGNVTLDNRTGDGYGYGYNSAGRLSEFRINGVLQASYKYDALGRQAIRTLTSPTAITIHSVFDSQSRRIAEYNESTGALIREYVWNGWEAIAVIEGGVISYVRTDHIGRPVFATNSTGAVVWTNTYLPFGGVRTTTGIPIEARFPGQWFQSESGLYQNWMRDYDPTTGRYLQTDPLGLVDGASVYGYAGQSPMMNMDPRGECFGPAAPLLPACIFLAAFIYDYLTDEDDCYTLWDYGWFVFDYLLPGPRQKPSYHSPEGGGSGVVIGNGSPITKIEPRTTRDGGKAARVTHEDGSVTDISPSRVKEYQRNTNPRAPSGAMDRVKFGNAIPGSKGYKRAPNSEEINFLGKLK